MHKTLTKSAETYDTKITLIAAIDDFINKKKTMSQNDKWNAFNVIAKEYGFPLYTGDLPDKNELVGMINTEIRKRNLSVWEK